MIGGQHAGQRGLHVVDGLVDDVVGLDVDPLVRACWTALGSGFTLKPMMMAFDAEASMTSVSVMAPTAPWMTRTLTSSRGQPLERRPGAPPPSRARRP